MANNNINIVSNSSNNYQFFLFSCWDRAIQNTLLSFFKKNNYDAIFILADSFVNKHYLPQFLSWLKEESVSVHSIAITSLEKNKNLLTCQLIYQKMLSLNLSRKTLFINFGGGIISDLGGFVASTYKRGVDFINIPTSLLAMVDASIGGKVGVDFGEHKNAVGLFINPKLVLINLSFLRTLPRRELFNGWAEIIKHGLIHDKDFFRLVTQKAPDLFNEKELMQIIKKSCEIKYFYVKNDERDSGKRQLLNFGHTIGHALESYFLSSPKVLKHGESIFWGMLIEAHISNLMGVLSDKEYFFIKEKFEKFELVKVDFNSLDLNKLKSFILNDKKNQSSKIVFNLIKKIGEVEYGHILDLSKLDKALNAF